MTRQDRNDVLSIKYTWYWMLSYDMVWNAIFEVYIDLNVRQLGRQMATSDNYPFVTEGFKEVGSRGPPGKLQYSITYHYLIDAIVTWLEFCQYSVKHNKTINPFTEELIILHFEKVITGLIFLCSSWWQIKIIWLDFHS